MAGDWEGIRLAQAYVCVCVCVCMYSMCVWVCVTVPPVGQYEDLFFFYLNSFRSLGDSKCVCGCMWVCVCLSVCMYVCVSVHVCRCVYVCIMCNV